MNGLLKDIEYIFSTEALKSLCTSDFIRINQLNAAITILITAGIPFDISFSPGTRRVAAAAELTIYINPTTTVQFVLSFEGGGSIFGGNN